MVLKGSLHLKCLWGNHESVCGAFLNLQAEDIALTCLLSKEQPLLFFAKPTNESMSKGATGL